MRIHSMIHSMVSWLDAALPQAVGDKGFSTKMEALLEPLWWAFAHMSLACYYSCSISTCIQLSHVDVHQNLRKAVAASQFVCMSTNN